MKILFAFYNCLHLGTAISKNSEGGIKKPVIIVGTASKGDGKKKGELMEQNQDALEYSSEEESEDIRDTMASINSKGKKVSNIFIIFIGVTT